MCVYVCEPGFFRALNQALRAYPQWLHTFLLFIRLFASALSKLPRCRGVSLFRGLCGNHSKLYKKGTASPCFLVLRSIPARKVSACWESAGHAKSISLRASTLACSVVRSFGSGLGICQLHTGCYGQCFGPFSVPSFLFLEFEATRTTISFGVSLLQYR